MTTIKKSYPQALPHRAPTTDTAAECARWRRRAYALIALVLVLAVLSTGVVVYFVKDARSRDAVARSDQPVDARAFEAPASATPTPKPASTGISSKTTMTSLAPAGAKISIEPAAPARGNLQKNRFLEALGSLSAAHLFQSYLNIGLLADSVESEAYTTDEAADTMRSINVLMDQVDAQLDKLASFGLDADDRGSIEQIKTVSTLLRVQAKLLQEYWDTNDMAKATQYHEARKAAWKGLTKVLQVSGE